MNSLSCIDSVKGRTRRSTARIREAVASQSLAVPRPSGGTNVPYCRGCNYLYDVEVIEEEHRVKIHYVGYGPSSDEWIRKSEIQYKPIANSFIEPPDEVALALSTLASSIKQKLVPSRKHEDPAIRIQLAMNKNTIQLLRQHGRSLGKQRGQEVYGISEYSDLDQLLEEQWHMRINNTSGDFSYAIKETT